MGGRDIFPGCHFADPGSMTEDGGDFTVDVAKMTIHEAESLNVYFFM